MEQENKKLTRLHAFQEYMSDFYYALAVVFFLVAVFFMFNEPTGASMLSFDLTLLVVVFAILYAAATVTKEMVLKFIAKYLVLIGLMIATYQYTVDFGYGSTLQIVFWITIVVFTLVFIFDFLTYFKDIVEKIWDMFAKRR